METEQLIPAIVNWLTDYADNNGIQKLVVGVSGGIDSAVVERLCERTGKKVIAVAMPMAYEQDSCPGSLQRAIELANGKENVMFVVKPIGKIVQAYREEAIGSVPDDDTKAKLLQGNLRSRIRANILYDYAGMYGGIVIGTGNKDEDEIGYCTKGGDGLVDLCPLSLVHKSQVREMAAHPYIAVPQSTIDAIPSAGLWDGQTDEQELGMTYDEIEWALKSLEYDTFSTDAPTERQQEVVAKVTRMRVANSHKLRYPPVFDPKAPESYE